MAVLSADKNKRLCRLSIPEGEISYILIRSRHRRTLQIAIRDSLEVNVSAPQYLPQSEIEGFIQKKSGWILRKLIEKRINYERLRKCRYEDGQEFLFLGNKYPLEVLERETSKSSISFHDSRWLLEVPLGFPLQARESHVKKQLFNWYHLQAKEVLGSRLFYFARIMGLQPRRIVIKSQKTLWGSCSSYTGSIQLNWKLILAPLQVIDYVVVHELSHLAFPNHSRRFWQKVENTLPDYRQRQQWLKDNHYEMMFP